MRISTPMMCSTQTMVMPSCGCGCFEHVGGALHLRRVEAAEAFVGEQQLRLGCERAREFELLQRRGAEPVGRRRLVGRQPDQFERVFARVRAPRRGRSRRRRR